MQKAKRHVKRLGIGITGAVVLAIGLIAIPYPGPGWLIVFAGLAILATEFEWARRLLDFAKGQYDSWTEWLKRQHVLVRILVLTATGLIVITTLWLLNMFGLVNSLLKLPFDWIESPFWR